MTLPGETAAGVALADGRRLPYVLNGHLAFWVTLAGLAVGRPKYDAEGAFVGLGAVPLAFLYDDFLALAVAAAAYSVALSAALYAASFRRPRPLLAAPGNTGTACYDFFMGRELNPRVRGFDLKYFCELRPGLLGWAALDLGMVAKQVELHGRVSAPMVAVVGFQLLYVWDALFHERAILTTMDITTDGFGFMLAFGDLAWVPFTSPLPSLFVCPRRPARAGTASRPSSSSTARAWAPRRSRASSRSTAPATPSSAGPTRRRTRSAATGARSRAARGWTPSVGASCWLRAGGGSRAR